MMTELLGRQEADEGHDVNFLHSAQVQFYLQTELTKSLLFEYSYTRPCLSCCVLHYQHVNKASRPSPADDSASFSSVPLTAR